MNKAVIFGGTSGLAKKVAPHLNFEALALSSSDCDVRDYEQVVDKVDARNVALYFSVVNYDNLIENIDQKQLKHSIDVNICGYLNLLQAVSTKWKNTGGSVIYISSILSSSPIKGTAVYSSCKSFCDTATKVFALENAKHNITCNSIQLGYFDGGLTYKVPEKVLTSVLNAIPAKRLGDCEELAQLINTVVDNKYLNGSIIKLTGGIQ